MRKIIIPVSGGIDSAYLLVLANLLGHEPIPVFIRDNEELSYENKCAFKVTNHILGVDPIELKVPTCKQIEVQYPIEHSHLNTPGLVYWSGYKALMYSVCLAYGGAIGADEIWFGTYEWNDHFIDELPESAKNFRNVWATLYPELKVPTIEFPLMGSNKVETIKKLKQLDFPFDLTYSCFKDNIRGIHCGSCLGCKDRKLSFERAGVTDTSNFKWGDTLYTNENYPYTIEDLKNELVTVVDYIGGQYQNERKIPIGSILSLAHWKALLDYFKSNNPEQYLHRLPTYFGLLDGIRQSNKKSKYWQENLTFICAEGSYYPIVTLIDGDKKDGNPIIVTLGEGSMLETASTFWLKNNSLDQFGLAIKDEGCLETVVIDVHNMTKRFRRHLSKFNYVLYCTNKTESNILGANHINVRDIATLLEKYHNDAVNYWESKGKINSLTDNYLFQNIYQNIILVEIPGQGIAYLSQIKDGRYWDFSLRKDTPNVGNALLQKSCEIVKQLNEIYLDLGVAFFDWKNAWSSIKHKHLGIKYKD